MIADGQEEPTCHEKHENSKPIKSVYMKGKMILFYKQT